MAEQSPTTMPTIFAPIDHRTKRRRSISPSLRPERDQQDSVLWRLFLPECLYSRQMARRERWPSRHDLVPRWRLQVFIREALVISGNVIVVTFYYRLGAFGFLTLGDKESPANNATLDQLKAMAWAQKNIEKFGGNRRNVKSFGSEKGAFSVQMHLYIERSLPLFNRAAISSGAYTGNQIPTRSRAAYQWYDFAENVGCGSLKHNKTEMATCLQVTLSNILDSSVCEIFN